ncbi:energy-coupling factor transport system ATP-binding protein [Salsuginibacillus halophilus]|uniref:Energy-coupling factor transport system ATP-binding protein n=1 Tax=Salsuginibacillus halophilus TaxID=517424 RepID=A0A2P8HL04_9BACI|nr:ATP-binding cassette domain-containing protein [Salsuginibacillus halophilus]PSL46860.1 energy-coupling factor transport system ATP-binding protein [Salsuginibacillus halophilus]
MPLTTENLSYQFKSLHEDPAAQALAPLDLHIQDGKWLAVCGHTGSGKSTLVRLLKGLLTPNTGVITWGGETLGDNRGTAIRQDIGFVFQQPEHQLFEATIAKDLAFGPKLFGFSKTWIEERQSEVLTQVGLTPEILSRAPFQLSGGEKRRAAIAGVLMLQPRMLILDEPTAGLDPLGQIELLDMLESWRKETGATIIWITHDMNQAAAYAEEMVVLKEGHMLAHTTPYQLFMNEAHIAAASNLNLPRTAQLLHQLEKHFEQNIEADGLSETAVAAAIGKVVREEAVWEVF